MIRSRRRETNCSTLDYRNLECVRLPTFPFLSRPSPSVFISQQSPDVSREHLSGEIASHETVCYRSLYFSCHSGQRRTLNLNPTFVARRRPRFGFPLSPFSQSLECLLGFYSSKRRCRIQDFSYQSPTIPPQSPQQTHFG